MDLHDLVMAVLDFVCSRCRNPESDFLQKRQNSFFLFFQFFLLTEQLHMLRIIFYVMDGISKKYSLDVFLGC